MTRTQLVTQALAILGNTTLTTDAANWVNDILYELEASGLWKFLESTTTYQTEDTVQSIAFSASKWPAAALTDYSKGMFIESSEPRKLEYLPKEDFLSLVDGSTGTPTHFSVWNSTLYLFPTPATGALPLLTIHYYKEITVPTGDSDDLETVCNIKPKWQSFLKYGIIALGMAYENDSRFEKFQTLWEARIEAMKADNERE
jgi:hypothetical protein